MPLTRKKKAFADAKIAGKANKDAALAAGYSAATASQAGSRLVKDDDVVLYMQAVAAKAAADEARENGEPHPDAFEIGFFQDPRDFLKAVMNMNEVELRIRVDTAKALMPFEHTKKGEGGKKDATAHAAKQAASKFAPTAAPHLKVAK